MAKCECCGKGVAFGIKVTSAPKNEASARIRRALPRKCRLGEHRARTPLRIAAGGH